MRDPTKNIYLTLWQLFIEFFRKVKESLGSLRTGKNPEKGGLLFSWLDHIISSGPRELWRRPTGIGLAHLLFAPIAFLFAHIRNPSTDALKK